VEQVGGIPHGYVFEVPSAATAPVDAQPLRAMGRFVHEAVAVDPWTGALYLTEDRRITGDGTGSGFYRFTPTPGPPFGTRGRLEMLAVMRRPRYDTSKDQRTGAILPATWVPIAEPDPPNAASDSQAVFRQGWEQGGAVFNRLEGAWYGDGSVFFISTNGGDPHPGGDPGLGQVWQYTPRGRSGGLLTLLVESRDPEVMEAPDNIAVSPRGGLLACEDGDGTQYLRGVTRDGRVFDFATHNLEGSNEFAGANWSPDGSWLFVNVQDPGVTYGITGPWEEGAL
jgi:secreted PhoX family phosphatase